MESLTMDTQLVSRGTGPGLKMDKSLVARLSISPFFALIDNDRVAPFGRGFR